MGLWARIMEWLTQDGGGPAESGVRRASPGGIAVQDRSSELGAVESPETTAHWWAPDSATLVEPVEIPRLDLTTEARAIENLLVSHFDGHDLNMPPLLHSAEQVLSRLRDRDCNLGDVSHEIAADPVIAASVLRMANSPLYRGLHKITALHPAVTRLGVKALRMLMMHESFRAAVFKGKGRDQWAERIWANSRASAHVMHGLSAFTRVDAEDAFLLGLLHDIGEVIVLRIVRANQARSHAEIDDQTFDYLCGECHQEFGELVAAEWKLPPTFRSLIADHHTPPTAEDPLRTERLQLQLCDMIVAMLGYAPPASYNLLNTTAVRDLCLQPDRRDFQSFLERLPAELEEAFDSF